MNTQNNLLALKKFIQANAIVRNAEKPIVMASGLKTDIYFDMKRATLNPLGLELVSQCLWQSIAQKYSQKTVQIAGVSVGGDPLVAGVLLESNSQSKNSVLGGLLVRKEPKSHGASKGSAVDGGAPSGDGVILLEDVVSTGGSSAKALRFLIEANYKVLGLICIVDREMGGLDNLKREFANIQCDALFKMSDFV